MVLKMEVTRQNNCYMESADKAVTQSFLTLTSDSTSLNFLLSANATALPLLLNTLSSYPVVLF